MTSSDAADSPAVQSETRAAEGTAITDVGPDALNELSALSVDCVPCSKHPSRAGEHLKPAHYLQQRNPKKGASYAIRHANCATRIKALKSAWYYTWGTTPPDSAPADTEFVPMVWCAHKAKQLNENMANIQLLKQGQQGTTNGVVLSFNEPDSKDQANMEVEDAVNMYAEMQVEGLLIGSPAAVHADGQWMQEFVKQAEQRGLRIDFIAVHWYNGPDNVKQFLDLLHKVHRMYGRPIWVTEFAVADFKAAKESVKSNRFTDWEVQRFMREVLPLLDSLSFVHRYCWFSFGRNDKRGHFSALFNTNDTLTELGEIYANHQF